MSKLDTWCLVGLGNPGKKYVGHRHNVGWQILDQVIDTYHLTPHQHQKDKESFRGSIAGIPVYTLKPLTFMNLSGPPTASFTSFYKIPPERILVIHDELALPVGRVRIKQGGGHGGHNGLKSLDQFIGSHYWRLRVGISHPGDRDMVSDYVLSDFIAAEKRIIQPLIDEIATHLPLILHGDGPLFQNNVTTPNNILAQRS
jgi:PTH1 family peptidyl-tRNA hydrolase